MPASNVKESRFSLPSNLTVRAITAAHQDLLQFLEQNETSTIEFADETQVDISLIQLLEAARVYAGTGGKKIALARPATGALLDTLRRSGCLEGMSAEDAQFWLHQGEMQ